MAATNNEKARELCGVEIIFDFTAKADEPPSIVATPSMVDRLDLEFAAQFISSWSRPVFGPTQTVVTAEGKDREVVIRLFSELRPESFVASARTESLCDALADLFRQATLRESRDRIGQGRSG